MSSGPYHQHNFGISAVAPLIDFTQPIVYLAAYPAIFGIFALIAAAPPLLNHPPIAAGFNVAFGIHV